MLSEDADYCMLYEWVWLKSQVFESVLGFSIGVRAQTEITPHQCIVPQACMSFNTATVQEVRNGRLSISIVYFIL